MFKWLARKSYKHLSLLSLLAIGLISSDVALDILNYEDNIFYHPIAALISITGFFVALGYGYSVGRDEEFAYRWKQK